MEDTLMERYSRRILWQNRFRSRAGRPASVPLRLRRFLGSVLAAPLFLTLAPADAALQYTQNLNFQTSNQSMWKAGPQYVAGWSQEFSSSWDNSAGGGAYFDLATPSK